MYALERTKKSRPPSALTLPKKEAVEISVEETKKNRLDEVTASGMTVREQLEKDFANKFPARKQRPSINSDFIVKKPDESGESDIVLSPMLKEKNSELRNSRNNTETVEEKEKEKVKEKEKEKEAKSSIVESKGVETKPKEERKIEEKINTKAKIESKEIRQTNFKSLDIPKQENLSETITFQIPEYRSDSEDDSIEELPKVSSQKKSASKPVPHQDPRPQEKLSKSISRPPKIITNPSKTIDSFSRDISPRSPTKSSVSKPKVMQKKSSLTQKPYLLSKPSEESSVIHSLIPEDSNIGESTDIDATSQGVSLANYKDRSGYHESMQIVDSSEKSNTPYEKQRSVYQNKGSSDLEKRSIIKNLHANEESLPEERLRKCDKKCGRDIIAEISIGVQVDLYHPEENALRESSGQYFFPYNPNNIYGLRGDVYYQKSSFMPQARIPDLSTSIMFQPAYKYG